MFVYVPPRTAFTVRSTSHTEHMQSITRWGDVNKLQCCMQLNTFTQFEILYLEYGFFILKVDFFVKFFMCWKPRLLIDISAPSRSGLQVTAAELAQNVDVRLC